MHPGVRGGSPSSRFPAQVASSFGSLAKLQAAIAKVKRARTRSTPRYRVCAMPPTVLTQPKGSSIFFRHRCDLA